MKSHSILDDITSAGRNLFSKENSDAPLRSIYSDSDRSVISDSSNLLVRQPTQPLVIQQDFISWIEQYNGPKFSFIHCDFPQEKTIFFRLLHSLQKYSSKIASESSHLMLWFDMEHYAVTKALLNSAGFSVSPYPFMWAKARKYRQVSIKHPRYSYETAFLATRGERALVRQKTDHYRSPAIQSNLKPEPMLSHFFSMLIDETTDFFDPTADSGAATLAARNCGARSILGLETPQ